MELELRLMLGLMLAAAALLATAAQAQPPAHPRLFFRRADLKRISTLQFAAPQYLEERNFAVTYFASRRVTFPLPPRQPGEIENPPGFDPSFGRYPYWTGMARQIQARLEALALSYAATGDPGYARRAVEYMLALADWDTWSDPAYSSRTCLDTCHLTMGAAFAYDACWEAMEPAQRERICDALQRLGLGPLAQDAPERVEHNLQLLRNAALGLGSLAVLPERPGAQETLQAASDFFRWWLDLRETSPNTEGLGYSAYGLDHCLLLGVAAAQAEGEREMIEHPYVRRAVRWALYFWGPARSGLVNFCDSAGGHPFEVTMRAVNKYLRDPYAGYYLQQTGMLARRDFTALILHEPDPPIAWPPPWPTSQRFAHIGWAALRSGWGDRDTLFAFISSSSQEGHCHWDANHFALNCAGEWLATDAGYKSFQGGALTEYSQGTAAHNSILIAGAGQVEKAGGIADFFTSPPFDYVVGDASRAYDPAVLWRFLRRVMYVKPHFLVMLDELEAPEAKRFEWVLHTDARGQYQVEGKAPAGGAQVSAQKVALVKPGARLEVRFLEPVAAQGGLAHFPGAEDYPPYLTVRDSRPRESQRFLTVLTPQPQEASPFVLEPERYAQAGGSLARLESYGALLLRAVQAGEELTLNLPVPAEGEYQLAGHFLKSPAGGDWQVLVDGRAAGAVYRGYAPDVRTHQEWDLGAMTLSRGSHEFTFRVVGKHELSSGYLVGVQDIELRPTQPAPAERKRGPTRLRRLTGEGWVGAACLVAGEGGGESAQCRVYFRLAGGDEIADGDLGTDAEAALVMGKRKAEPVLAAHHATRLRVGGREVLEASAPISFALAPGDPWSLTLQADHDAQVVVFLRTAPRRPGIPPSLARSVRYDPTAVALRIRLRPGSHTITWQTG